MRGLHQLYDHRTIGLDFDNTLIDHRNSPLLHDFVAVEHGLRVFWILTHRTDRGTGRLWMDLHHASFGRLKRGMFAGVVHLPLPLYDAYCEEQAERAAGHRAGASTPAERTFLVWKAAQAKRLGCTVLVDDLADIHRLGCSRVGLAFVATDRL